MTTMKSHPYRETDVQATCVTCSHPALLHCPRCNRPFCADHASISACCADCELELSRRGRRAQAGGMTVYTAVVAVVSCIVFANSGFLGVTTVAFGVLGGILVAAMTRRIARCGADRGWTPVENAELWVGAEAGEPRHRRLVHLVAGRYREKDMYTAARNAGFNRVQGCA
jgi:hypothetical protein